MTISIKGSFRKRHREALGFEPGEKARMDFTKEETEALRNLLLDYAQNYVVASKSCTGYLYNNGSVPVLNRYEDTGNFYTRFWKGENSYIEVEESAPGIFTISENKRGKVTTLEKGLDINKIGNRSNNREEFLLAMMNNSFRDSKTKVTESDKKELIRLITRISEEMKLSPEVMVAFAAQESSLNPDRERGSGGTSSHLYGFIDSTWKDVVGKHGAKYGITVDQKADPRASTLMACHHLIDGLRDVKRITGKDLPQNLIYAVHFFGAGGASTLITTPDNKIAAEVFPKAAKSNEPIFYEKTSVINPETKGKETHLRPRTIGEIKTLLREKIEKHIRTYGGVVESIQRAGDLSHTELPEEARRQVEALGLDSSKFDYDKSKTALSHNNSNPARGSQIS